LTNILIGMKAGNTIWMIPGGHIPLVSTGKEPDYISRDELSILNANEQDASVNLTIYYTQRKPAGPFNLNIKERSVRNLRINDLVDPEPIPLDTEYAILVQSNIPVIVQFTRMNTGQPELAGCTGIAFPVDE
jgi:hypothetical protein